MLQNSKSKPPLSTGIDIVGIGWFAKLVMLFIRSTGISPCGNSPDDLSLEDTSPMLLNLSQALLLLRQKKML